jgi:hypothetical protein
MSQPADLILSAVGPDLYRVNAFRVAQLPVSATLRDVTRRLERIKMEAKLGSVARAPSGPLPLKPAPDLEVVRQSVERLHDPEQRLLDELFWFWPEQWGADDPALAALARGDLATARKTWQEAVKRVPPGAVSQHNLAVLAHALALDLEQRAGPPGQSLAGYLVRLRDQCWNDALNHWRGVLANEDFWLRLRERIQALNEPQLTPDLADAIRAQLPAALLGINAQLAVRAAEEGKGEEAQRHQRLLCHSGLEEGAIDSALRRALKPVRERIKCLCQTAAGPTQTENWLAALQLYERVAALPVRDLDRGTLQADVALVQDRVCWFCRRRLGEAANAAVVWLHGRLTRTRTAQGESVHWQRYVVDVPRCWYCFQEHRRWNLLQTMGTVPRGVRPESDTTAFPAVVKLLAEGWEVGAVPPGL